MHETNLILTVASGLAFGLLLGFLTNSVRLSPIVGYLLAGVVVGPFTPGFVADQHVAEQLAEIGVMLLMFGVGLHFHAKDLWAVRRIALPGAIAQITVATMLGAGVAHFCGWSWQAGIVFGLCLSVASTVVLTRVLVDNHQLNTSTGHVAIGWLIVEDLFTVLVLVLLPIFFADVTSGVSLWSEIGWLSVKLVTLVFAIFVLGGWLVPRLFSRVARSGSQELFTLTVLVVALGIAVASAKVFNVSMALGAFLAGMVVGKSEFSLRAATDVLPLRDAFAVLFFVSIGMLLDPSVFISHWQLILATMVVVIVGKTVAAFAIVMLLGHPVRVALGVSVALAQIGEFSFILASLSRQLGILDSVATQALVATAIGSITLNPILFRAVPRLERWLTEHRILKRYLKKDPTDALGNAPVGHHLEDENFPEVIVVGHGPVGKVVTKLLAEGHIRYAVIELDFEQVRNLKNQQIPAFYGDASRKDVLVQAGVEQARSLILALPKVAAIEEVIRQAKALNPDIHLIAAVSPSPNVGRYRDAGCDAVYAGDAELGISLVQEVVRVIHPDKEPLFLEREQLRFITLEFGASKGASSSH